MSESELVTSAVKLDDIPPNGVADNIQEPAYFENSFQQIQMELDRLDLYIRRFIYLFRKSLPSAEQVPPRSPGYISNEEVDALLQREYEFDYEDSALIELNKSLQAYDEVIDAMAESSIRKKIFLPLVQISKQFNLSWLEYQVLIVCLGSELRSRYDKYYAYLQDDITRKKPSIDFVLNLFAGREFDRWELRKIFSAEAALVRHGLLEVSDDPQSPSGSSGLAKLLRLDDRILQYILGGNDIDFRLLGLLSIESSAFVEPMPLMGGYNDIKQSLLSLIGNYLKNRSHESKNLIIHISAAAGVAKKKFVASICSDLSCPMLVVDAVKIIKKSESDQSLLKLAFRESLLAQGALYIENIDALLDGDETQCKLFFQEVDRLSREYGWLTFIGSQKSQRISQLFKYSLYYASGLDLPSEAQRALIWKALLKNIFDADEEIEQYSAQLSQRYVLSPDMIESAYESAYLLKLQKQSVNIEDLTDICRSQSGQGLSSYAKKIKSHYSWDDLILPLETKQVLKNICHQVENEHKVFSQWNFSDKIQYGRGLSVLYSGPPGTGKTMSAQVIANELQVDLYKIDLSGVVSKYIGETEKNLNRIFEEAENCNAILFFDEADALFGKRTEVSDAHDRYANIEVSYLLQKMEEYNGVVILATNLRGNMDNAFTRRIRFIIEFPFPDTKSRLQIWKNNIPQKAPLHEDVDFEYLSARVKVSGASIKNIVLNAAFYAAQKDRSIDMHCLSYSIEQEYRKIGKLWVAKDLENSNNENKIVSVKHV